MRLWRELSLARKSGCCKDSNLEYKYVQMARAREKATLPKGKRKER